MTGEAGVRVTEHLAVAYAKSLYPALLTERDRDEEAELDELGLAEVPVQ